MDKGAWRATGPVVARVGHDLVTDQPTNTHTYTHTHIQTHTRQPFPSGLPYHPGPVSIITQPLAFLPLACSLRFLTDYSNSPTNHFLILCKIAYGGPVSPQTRALLSALSSAPPFSLYPQCHVPNFWSHPSFPYFLSIIHGSSWLL